MKTQKLKMLFLVGMLGMGSGCVSVPTSRLPTPFGTFYFPKNVEISGLEITKTTNGLVIKIESYKAHNDPNVIASSAAGQAIIIEKVHEGAATIAGEVVSKMK